MILKKLFSGRFLAFMMVTWTLCNAVNLSLSAVFGVIKIDPATKEVVEKIAMYILGAFTTIATGMYKEYWDQGRNQTQTEVPK
ncbi:hypothetical protein CCP3SC15_150009 [Gammaproteobacteria bacterium]